MRKRNRSKPLQPIGEILHRILEKNNIHLPREGILLKKIWNQAVGPMIAVQTRPDRIAQSTLYVKVSTSVWMHQLQFLKEDILEKFQNHWKQKASPVSHIHFSVGAIKSTEENVFFQPTTILLKDRDKALIEESLQMVCDPELKEILGRVMSKEICRRRYFEHHRK
jgi:hypothetical protein